MWFYVQRILIPYQQADAALHHRPRGNLSDLYPRWLGARELLLHHRNPYSTEITREIQIGYYGRALDAARADDPQDQQGFAYPVYVTFLLAPTIFFPFTIVQAVFGSLLIALTCMTVFLWLRVLRWKPPTITFAIFLLLSIGCFPAAQGIKLQQLTLLVCGLIAGSAVLIVGDQLVLAGIFLAVATSKPQIVALLIPWLLLWAASEWRARKRFVVGFVCAMTVLLVGARLILPGWIKQFLGALAAYRQYTGGGGSVLDVLISPIPGKLLAAVLIFVAVVVCWKTRHFAAHSKQFSCTLAMVLAVTVTVIPMTAPYNQLLLLPAVFLFVRDNNFFSKTKLYVRVLYVVCGLLIVWPWLAAAGLSLASCFLPATTIQRAWAMPLYTSLAIPPAVVALLTSNVLEMLRQSRTT